MGLKNSKEAKLTKPSMAMEKVVEELKQKQNKTTSTTTGKKSKRRSNKNDEIHVCEDLVCQRR